MIVQNPKSDTEDSLWVVRHEQEVPATGNTVVTPPLSPTLFESLTACPLQVAYKRSHALPARSGPSARLGHAFHNIMELFHSLPPEAQELTGKEWRKWAVEQFKASVAEQRTEAAKLPRERYLEWPAELETRMTVRVATTAGTAPPAPVWRELESENSEREFQFGSDMVSVAEMDLRSKDGLLGGRPDLVERLSDGSLLVTDYKTGDLRSPNKVARYRRQCLLYVALIHENTGEWPSKYQLINPLTGDRVEGDVDPMEAAGVAEDARTLLRSLLGIRWSDLAATPGPDVCPNCSYRPWCPAYWQVLRNRYDQYESRTGGPSQFALPMANNPVEETEEDLLESVMSAGTAMTSEPIPSLSFEAILGEVHWPDRGDTVYFVCSLDERSPRQIKVSVPRAAFGHLRYVPVGSRLRVLDARPVDETQGTLRLTLRSEVFQMEQNPQQRGDGSDALSAPSL